MCEREEGIEDEDATALCTGWAVALDSALGTASAAVVEYPLPNLAFSSCRDVGDPGFPRAAWPVGGVCVSPGVPVKRVA